jgi:DnaJ-class molecular chaperone
MEAQATDDNGKDLYKILELEPNATSQEIKTKYKKLALKYHPDKSKNKSTESNFHNVSFAYSVLCDSEQRKKYNTINNKNKASMTKWLEKLTLLFSDHSQYEIFVNTCLKNDECNKIFATKNKELIKKFISSKLMSYLVGNKKSEQFTDDIGSFMTNQHTEENENVSEFETSYEQSTEINDNDIHLDVETDLNEIYSGDMKEIVIKRQRFAKRKIIMETKKILIPLCDDKIILEKEGDDCLDEDGLMKRGNVIIKIRTHKHKTFKRVNDHDLYTVRDITLNQLFYGFNKQIQLLDNTIIDIKAETPMETYKFNGESIMIKINGKGMPCDDNQRGDLFLVYKLNKDKQFKSKIEKHFA